VVPSLARIYPNGEADVNHFHAAGGMSFLIRELLLAGLLHNDVHTVVGYGLDRYLNEPVLVGETLQWQEGVQNSLDEQVLRPVSRPFAPEGGIRVLSGTLGRAVIKVSAVKPEHRRVEAPARVFSDQESLVAAFKRGELNRDVVVVVRYQGPRANGMPELHSLTPVLTSLQARGHKVALVTDGRMSGASGKVPAAIHLTPEAAAGGPLALLQDGDVIRVDAVAGTVDVQVDTAVLKARKNNGIDLSGCALGLGRELFGVFRRAVSSAEEGAHTFGTEVSGQGAHAFEAPFQLEEPEAEPVRALGEAVDTGESASERAA
jgi:phosphogluconate dehydratase